MRTFIMLKRGCNEKMLDYYDNELYKKIKYYLSKIFNTEIDNIYLSMDLRAFCIDENNMVGILLIKQVELKKEAKDVTDTAVTKLLQYLISPLLWIQEVPLDKAIMTFFLLGYLRKFEQKIEEIGKLLNEIKSNIKK